MENLIFFSIFFGIIILKKIFLKNENIYKNLNNKKHFEFDHLDARSPLNPINDDFKSKF